MSDGLHHLFLVLCYLVTVGFACLLACLRQSIPQRLTSRELLFVSLELLES